MNKRQRQLVNNLNDIFGGYMNGMSDCPEEFPALTVTECIDYAIAQIYDIKATGTGMTMYGRNICRDLRFLGREYIDKEIIRIADECEVIAWQK